MQTDNGGFVSERWSDGELAKPTLRTTRTALRAYRLLGGKPPNRDKIIALLENCYDKRSGGFSSEPGRVPDPISTSVALLIFGELELPVEPYLERGLKYMNDNTSGFEQVRMIAASLDELHRSVPNAHKWLTEIDRTRNRDGSFGVGPGLARTTALNLVAEMRLGARPETTRVLSVLEDGRRADGGYGGDKPGDSDLEACYRIVRLYHRMGIRPSDPEKLSHFIDSCRNDDGGYGRTPDELSSLHGTYYATIIRSWLQQLSVKVQMLWDFNATALEELPQGWIQDRTLDEPGSEWRTESDSAQPSNRILVQTSSKGPKKQFNLCIANEEFMDVSLSVKLRSRTGQIDRGGGMVWRYKDSRNYYIARWNPLEMNLRLYKVVDGIRSQLDTAQAPGDPTAWHTLRIVTVGRDIRGYFDGKLLTEVEDDQFPNAGRIGLWSKSDAVTEFDEFAAHSAWKEMIEDFR